VHDDSGSRGLAADLALMAAMDRRSAMRILAGAALTPLWPALACDDAAAGAKDVVSTLDAASDALPDDTAASETAAVTCEPIPPETGGPYPGDGSIGPNVLAMDGVNRRDIRTSIGTASGTAPGIPMTMRLTIVDAATCAALAGRAVYVWQCDRDAEYSMYTLTTENYLRGVQVTDPAGVVEFLSIFPACYAGRWPHVHFEVYADLAAATASAPDLGTSQLALPKAACDEAYATAGYEQSVVNLSKITLATDGVFKDGAALQLATMSGSVASGYTATLTVGV
jgi:protocatechuate 3,4-dioxygenase beta subunit